ncbi:YopT-type cysteine protease domain-containing protein [Roseomonas rosulenta]|uniref:YopT-type cysteine protease domain-containing protein n=1 Tax=Roseomonas rosulenta TaxID=2748667 RepID=UPI0018DF1051|nr:YopT-type cysteine protease domain-containing protein [Roseomonas rosulenta]
MEVTGYKKSFSMDQGDVLGNDQTFQALYNAPLTDGKREGICTGLSMIWAARRMMFHDETADQRSKALYTGAGFRWGGKTQDIHVASGVSGTNFGEECEVMYGEALRAYVLRIVPNTALKVWGGGAAGDAAAIWPTVSETGSYCLFNIGLATNTGNAAHCVASYSSHGSLLGGKHFYLFDPNMGEYRVSTSDGVKFLGAFLEAYERDFVAVRYVGAFEVRRG